MKILMVTATLIARCYCQYDPFSTSIADEESTTPWNDEFMTTAVFVPTVINKTASVSVPVNETGKAWIFDPVSSSSWYDNHSKVTDDIELDSAGVVICNAGSYLPVGASGCILCETGTYSEVQMVVAYVECKQCPKGTFSGSNGNTQCMPCPAGSFSYFDGSSVCSTCPAWTGSSPGMSECVTCSNSTGCVYAGPIARSCPRCDSACTPCKAGYYNDGASAAGCVACGPGTFNPIQGASSSAQCQACGYGTFTKPTSSGLTVCLQCSSGMVKPVNTVYIDSTESGFDPLLCKWKCATGYKMIPSGIEVDSPTWSGYYSYFTGVSQQYTHAQAVQLIGLRTDYCCDVRGVIQGKFLDGCDKSNAGIVSDCNPILNGHYVKGVDGDFLSRCDFWECDDGYYKLNQQCVMQPVCEEGYTYKRDIDGLYIAELETADGSQIEPPGRYICVPCPVCVGGSETLVECNRTHSPVCRMCGGSKAYSADGGPCVEDVPYGYRKVYRLFNEKPLWGERPMYLYNGEAFTWSSNMIFSSYVKCSPSGVGRSYTGNDEACLMDVSNKCDQCETQCSPWKRVGGWFMGEGWFASSGGQCESCAYDPGRCSDYGEYLDMSTCGPVNQPQCASFGEGVAMVNGQENWANPRAVDYNGIHPCRVICKTGFMELNNVCIDCTSLPGFPNNAVPINGCSDWTCPRGFLKRGDFCEACSGELKCSNGYFPGYGAENNVCLDCMPCIKPNNAIFISNGTRGGGVTSCRFSCNDNWFMENSECVQCTQRSCQAGLYYLKSCTSVSNSECLRCTTCSEGYNTSRPCTVNADTICTPCENNGYMPANAVWDGSGCKLWKCASGYWLNSSACVSCKIRSQCAPNEKLEIIGACSTVDSGKCVPCDPPPAAGMCFTGDGQCGKVQCANTNVKKSTTKTAAVASTSVRILGKTSVSSTFNRNDLLSTSSTIMAAVTNTTAITTAKASAFATVAALTVDVTEKVTAVLLVDLVNSVKDFVCANEVGSLCNVTVLSITENNKTTICVKGVCPGYTSRRHLLSIKGSGVDIGILTEQAVSDLSSLFDHLVNVVSYKVMPNAQVVNINAVADAGVFLKLVSSDYTDYRRVIVILPTDSGGVLEKKDISSYIIATVIAAVVVVVVLSAVFMRWKNNGKIAQNSSPPQSNQSGTPIMKTQFDSILGLDNNYSPSSLALNSIRITRDNYKPFVKTA